MANRKKYGLLADKKSLLALTACLAISPIMANAADAPPRSNSNQPVVSAGSDAGEPEMNGDRPVFYRPLRTSPDFRHPPGYGSVPRKAVAPTPLAKPLPPEFGYANIVTFEDVTPLDELDAIGLRLVSVALDEPVLAAESLRQIDLRGEIALVPPLIHAMQFSRLPEAEIARVLRRLTNENLGRTWFQWAQWLEANPELILSPSLAAAVTTMWSSVDGKYRAVLPAERAATVSKASIFWDGSRVDAIPSQNTPRAVPPNEAFGYEPNDLVIGVTVNGQHRAYSHAQLLLNPIINDELGGHAITVAFEPYCGFPVAFDRGLAGQPAIGPMEWSGLVYRSSRLLYDPSNDHRLWDTCTGRAITKWAATLRQAPATVTSWSAWRGAYKTTTAMSTGNAPKASRESLEAQDEYIGSGGLIYPVHLNHPELPAKERMLLLQMGEEDHAIRLGDFKNRSVINHRFNGQGVVIVVENPINCTIRVYERPEGQLFGPSEFVDRVYGSGGGVWRATEEALIGPDGERLARIPGRGLFWFTVDGFNPMTETKADQSASLPN
ncbi:MAG: DUF3179 domain-containing protein [Alphaproteobacteria bacterium]|nr:DUF3179 domain-containing protein [Alphaproteobacteria bacterium SS10]